MAAAHASRPSRRNGEGPTIMAQRDETPRDLLFGLLALQIGLIDQEKLIGAFSAWSRAKGKALAEILIERGSIDEESRALLAGMAEKQLKLHGGDTEKSLAALAAGASTRERLTALGHAELSMVLPLVGSTTEVDDPFRTASHAIGTLTSEGQRFRILRPHAKGGLGAVFVALDGELNREVALKEILDRHADDPASRARFLLEAEITGGLEHPGIVPVYGLGSYADGRPYYAMRFIRGDSLKEAIASFHEDPTLRRDPGKKSLALRRLLRRFVDVCNAVDYAHGRGVLHRDIKPSNVVVGKHGETLVVDWGLAKAMGSSETGPRSDERTLMPSASSGSGETLPGSAIGTPAFMSPEQSLGDLDRLGPRTDIYSLGATLYSLLTGKAPFEGNDLGTLLRDVQKGAFPKPRQVDPSIDRALEAVCLKAMATNPEDRYEKARALADDVERWAADEPTSAWAEPFSVRARRWMKRNRTVVTAASVALLAAVAGNAAVLAVETQANVRLASKNTELDKANAREAAANAGLREANDRVQARFELAREAIRSFQAGVNDDDMLKGMELKGLRNKLLRSAAGFYEKLEKLLQGHADRTSLAILAQSYFELGELTDKIGIQPEALTVHRKALAIRRELAALLDADAETKLDLARSLIATGLLAKATGDYSGALSAFEEARGVAMTLTSDSGSTDAARYVVGICYHRIGSVLSKTGKTAESLESYHRALAVYRKLAEEHPAITEYSSSLAACHNDMGFLLYDTGHPAEALDSCRAGIAIKIKLVADNPGVPEFRNDLAVSHADLGIHLRMTGYPAEALDSYLLALEILGRLVKDNLSVTVYPRNLARMYKPHRPAAKRGWGNGGGAGIASRAFAIRVKLAEENPAVSEYQEDLADSFVKLGFLNFESGRLAEALEDFSRETAIIEKLAADNPSVLHYRNRLANSLVNTAALLLRTGRPAEARGRTERAVALMEPQARDHPEAPWNRQVLAEGYLRLGLAREAEGDLAGAAADWKQAVALFQSAPVLHGEYTFLHGGCHASLAALAGKPGTGLSPEEGEAEVAEAMILLRRAVEMGYRNTASYHTEPALDPLRSRPDFRLLMLDLAFPSDPFKR
jgi:serine/threonine protein kinase